MKNATRVLALAALIACQLTAQSGSDRDRDERGRGGYVETDLVVNRQIGGVPTLLDSNGITHIANSLTQI